jgi:hypothetical protein
MRPKTVVTLAFLGIVLLAVPAVAQDDPPAPAPTCVIAFSKDLCSAALSGGTWAIPPCVFGATSCNHLLGNDATFSGPLTSSSGRCGEDFSNLVPCDEAPHFTGTLVATVDVRTQRHTSCKARGSWDGPFRLLDSDGVAFATGDLVATMGMGTHREACDNDSCSKTCETCHDARVISHAYDWQIGTEGTLNGRVLSGRYAGCTFIASFQGDFTANGDSRGPQVPDPRWGHCGTLEGALSCPCDSGGIDPTP